MSLLPVILPVVLILIGTVVGAVMEETPGWISFISNKSIALLIGALVAYLVSSKNMNRDEREASVTEALKSCGIVLMITGAGGSFGAIISATVSQTCLPERSRIFPHHR